MSDVWYLISFRWEVVTGVGNPNTQGGCGNDIAFLSSLFPMSQTAGDLMVLVAVALQGIESPQEPKLRRLRFPLQHVEL